MTTDEQAYDDAMRGMPEAHALLEALHYYAKAKGGDAPLARRYLARKGCLYQEEPETEPQPLTAEDKLEQLRELGVPI